jgi:F-type H+-transporting ATPase subunit epsilon
MAHPAFDFEVITPEGSAFRGRVTAVRAPGRDGSFGILARHAPLLGALSEGMLRYDVENGATEVCAVGEGFVEVTKTGVRVLVDFCEPKAEIDLARAERAKKRAEERLRDRDSKIDHARAEAALRRAIIRISVASYEALD